MKKTNFFNQDKKIYAFLLFFAVLTVDILAAMLGFGGAQFIFHYSVDIDMFSSIESLIFSALVICFNLLVIIYAYRNNQPNKLKALGFANLIMSVIPFVFNSIYYPFSYLIIEAITDLSNISDSFHFSDFRFYLAEFVSVPMCICCFALLFRMKQKNKEINKKVSFSKMSLAVVVLFVFISISGLYICNTPVSEEFNYSGLADLTDIIVLPLKNNQTDKLFDSINGDMDFSQADELLRNNGFIPHTEIEEYVKEKEDLDICLDNLEDILSNVGEIVYTKPDKGYISYNNRCIVLFRTEDGKVKSKKIIEAYNHYTKKDDTAKAKELFEAFELNADKKTVLRKMEKVTDVVSLSVEYGENVIKEVYSFYAFKDLSFLHLVDNTYFNADIIFENSILKGGNYTYTTESNYDSDDVVCDIIEYVIK